MSQLPSGPFGFPRKSGRKGRCVSPFKGTQSFPWGTKGAPLHYGKRDLCPPPVAGQIVPHKVVGDTIICPFASSLLFLAQKIILEALLTAHNSSFVLDLAVFARALSCWCGL